MKAVIQKHDKASIILTESKLIRYVTSLCSRFLTGEVKTRTFLLLEELSAYLRKSEYLESTLETFFATGNLVSESGLGLQQDKGWFRTAWRNICLKMY